MLTIRQRPFDPLDRSQAGHWEGDLIIGKDQGSAIGTLVEPQTPDGPAPAHALPRWRHLARWAEGGVEGRNRFSIVTTASSLRCRNDSLKPTMFAVLRAQARPEDHQFSNDPGDAGDGGNVLADDRDAPVALLWLALSTAPPDGSSLPELMTATGMSRPWGVPAP